MEKQDIKENDAIIDQIKKAADSIRNDKPFIKDLINFYEKIFILQYMEDPEIDKDYSFLTDQKEFPLLGRKDFGIDFKVSEKLFRGICDICAENKNNPEPSAKSIKNSLDVSDLSFESIVKTYLEDNSPVQHFSKPGQGFNPQLYDFILYNALKPSIVKNSKMISQFVKNTTSMENGRCPVCNSAPALSLISDKDGSRSLVCSFCWHEYKIDDAICPFCKNNESMTLKYIALETEKGIRADYCEKCKKYIKRIDLKEYRKDIYLPFELIASIPFDMEMNKKGFKPE